MSHNISLSHNIYPKTKNHEIYYDNKKIQRILNKIEEISKVIFKIQLQHQQSNFEKNEFLYLINTLIENKREIIHTQWQKQSTFKMLKEIYGTSKQTQQSDITKTAEKEIDKLMVELLNKWENRKC